MFRPNNLPELESAFNECFEIKTHSNLNRHIAASNKTILRISYTSFIGFDTPCQVNDIPTMTISTANP